MTSAPDLPTLRRAADVVRGLAMDAVQKANSGHPGMPMGMADVAAAVWLRHLRYDVQDAAWRGRDRFVLSAGHGSMLLYSLLHLAGFEVTLDDLKDFRQLHSKTPGHPEVGETQGVETTTGPLGQGFTNGVGMALAARIEAARFECPLADRHRVVGIVSDGDLMEGVASEAASLAGHLRLSNLVYFYDDNSITIDGRTDIAWSEDVPKRFAAYGWRILELHDAHDTAEVCAVVDRAMTEESDRPTLVVCKSHIGYGSPSKQDTSGAHGAPLGDEEIKATKEQLGLPADETFYVDDAVRVAFRQAAAAKTEHANAWRAAMTHWEGESAAQAAERSTFLSRGLPEDLLEQLVATVADDAKSATRALSGKVIQRAAELVPSLVTGSADLDASCKTAIKASGSVQAGDYGHRNLHFGIREHAMAGMLNGMALHGGFLPAGSTFLVFSDYCRPSIRLAALMGVPSIFVFTHDSLYVGEDGPTHQPVEHVAALRLIPGLHVFRPADGVEVAAAWTHALSRTTGPTALALTRQGLPALDRGSDFEAAHALRGGYVLREVEGAQATVVATGSEVSVVVEAVDALAAQGIALRIVSMPCLELFLDQPRSWREAVLPADQTVLAVEIGRPESWCVLTGNNDHVVGLSRFGLSAPAAAIAQEFGFTAEGIAEQLRSMLPA